jgi:hypothetical protein
MGGLLSSFTGSDGSDAAKKAAAIQAEWRNKAIGELEKIPGMLEPIKGMYEAAYSPYITQGEGFMGEFAPRVQSASTFGGFSQRLGNIMESDIFQPLLDERMEAAQTQLANTGLSRSGAALREAARIPTDLAMQLENQLYGRQVAGLNYGTNLGLGAQGARVGGIADVIGQQAGVRGSVANVMSGIGDVYAQGRLGGATAGAGGAQNMMNMGMQGLGMYGASQGWFGK